MHTSTIKPRSLVKALAAAFAAAAFLAPAALAEQPDGRLAEVTAPDAVTSVGYRSPDGAVGRLPSNLPARDGWEGRFEAPAVTIGYRSADGHVAARPADETSIRDGWQGRFDERPLLVGYRTADGHVPESTSPPPASLVVSDRFDWSDAGAGAGVVLGVILVALLTLIAMRQRRHLAHS
jgi:hypothetical protein